nr:hypothetical protein [Rhodoferax sp.]
MPLPWKRCLVDVETGAVDAYAAYVQDVRNAIGKLRESADYTGAAKSFK